LLNDTGVVVVFVVVVVVAVRFVPAPVPRAPQVRAAASDRACMCCLF